MRPQTQQRSFVGRGRVRSRRTAAIKKSFPKIRRWPSVHPELAMEKKSPPSRSIAFVFVAALALGASGLPLGPAADRARILPVTIDAATSVGQAEDPGTDPYPIWYFAFADLNNNGHPDAGEPFGVDPRNPSSSGCGRYQGTIVIDKTLH